MGRLLSTLLLLFMCSCSIRGEAPSNARLLDDFMYTAFGRERTGIYKIDSGDVCIKMLGSYSAEQAKDVVAATSLYSLEGFLKFRFDGCTTQTELVLVFIPDAVNNRGAEAISEYALKELGENVLSELPESFVRFYRNRVRTRYAAASSDHLWVNKVCMVGPSIYLPERMHVVISISNNYGYMRECIYEEILQSLGLPYDANKSWPSIMQLGPSAGIIQPASNYDILYLRILYDPRIRRGMSEKEVREIAKVILDEVRPDQTREPPLESLQ